MINAEFLVKFVLIIAVVLSGGTTLGAGDAPNTVSGDDIVSGTQIVDNHGSHTIAIRELRPGVWLHTSWYTFPNGKIFPSNGLIVRDGDGLLLVDTAWGEAETVKLLEKIEARIGLSVRRAIVTHFHYDRLAGVDVLEKRGVEVLAHPLTSDLAMKIGMPVPNKELEGLEDAGSAVTIGAVEVFFPGAAHAPDNVMVWVPEAKVLFGGCAVRDGGATSLGNKHNADLENWPKAVRQLQERYAGAEIVVPGHGNVGGPKLLGHTLELLGERMRRK